MTLFDFIDKHPIMTVFFMYGMYLIINDLIYKWRE